MDKASVDARIETMARRDKMTAIVFTVAMWVVLLFTFFAVRTVAPTVGVSVALGVSLMVLGIFNTASIITMIRCYAKDKDFIYREDIANLDRNRERKLGKERPEKEYAS